MHLTGAVLSRDRYAIDEATKALQNCAGNFYINDKPTGRRCGTTALRRALGPPEPMIKPGLCKTYCDGYPHD
jgi:hypothetical protein